MIFAALFILFFSSSSDALGPILSDLDAMDGQVVQLGLPETQQEDLRKSLKRVAAASASQASTIETSQRVLRELVADHDASRVQLESALRAAIDADRKQADAALDAYFDLRERLTAEQWSQLLQAAAYGDPEPAGMTPGSTGSASVPPDAESIIVADDTGWSLSLTPYVWIPAQSGDVAVRGNPASVDLSVGDTFDTVTDNFNFAATLRLEAQRDRWTLIADAMYLSIEAEDNAGGGDTVDIRQDQGIFELAGAYAIIDRTYDAGITLRLEPLAGVRLHHLELDIDSSMSGSLSGDQTWLDGFVGARCRVGLTERLSMFARADVGAGGSDLTWNALGGVQFDLCDRVAFLAGYRALDIDYSDGRGTDRFQYDVTLHGPFVAVTITF